MKKPEGKNGGKKIHEGEEKRVSVTEETNDGVRVTSERSGRSSRTVEKKGKRRRRE